METDLVLVSLNEDQISKAKDANGKRKQITHALICGKYGVMYGTEKQCRKYHSTWKEIFKNLFGRSYETDSYDLKTYKCSGNMVMDLVSDSDKLKREIDLPEETAKRKKKGLWSKLFGD